MDTARPRALVLGMVAKHTRLCTLKLLPSCLVTALDLRDRPVVEETMRPEAFMEQLLLVAVRVDPDFLAADGTFFVRSSAH